MIMMMMMMMMMMMGKKLLLQMLHSFQIECLFRTILELYLLSKFSYAPLLFLKSLNTSNMININWTLKMAYIFILVKPVNP